MEISPTNSRLAINSQFYKVFKKIADKRGKKESIASELAWINSQLGSDNRNICEDACFILREFGLKFDYGTALNTLVTSFARSENGNFDLVADALMGLLTENISECLNFQISEKTHPAILLLREKEVNGAKLAYLSLKIEEIFNSPRRSVRENAAQFLRPVLLTILCSSEAVYSESRDIWRTIVDSENESLAREILSLRRATSPRSCTLLNSMVVLRLKRLKDPESMLLLLSATKRMAEMSLEISSNLELLKSNVHIIESSPHTSNVTLFLLAEILQISSIKYIPKIAQLLDRLVVKAQFGHVVVLHMILDGLVQALAYPSFVSREMQPVENLVNYIRSRKFLDSPRPEIDTSTMQSYPFLRLDKHLSNAYDICIYIESNVLVTSQRFTRIEHDHERLFWTRNHLVLRGVFHAAQLANVEGEQWRIILANLLEISKTRDELKSSLVMPLLFRLAETFDPRLKVTILQGIIELGASAEIFSTIKALSGGMLRSMAIDLYLRLWKIEPRIYSFLYKSLVEKSKLDSEDVFLEIVRAAAIKEICDLKPHHGSDLVGLISQILTESMDSENGELSAALAIDAITLLCKNHIISITSTWRAINLSTRNEKRQRVIRSLCKFFSIVPQFRRNNNLEYENFNKEIVARLFHMIEWGEPFAMECALHALKSWSFDTFTFDMIPDTYRENIALPQAAPGMEVSILDLEVPGECYVQLLMKVNASALRSTGELLSHFIKQEVGDYRSGYYIVKEGQAEPMNYKNLPKQSIVKALVHFLIQQAATKREEKIVDDSIIAQTLHVIAQKFARPLPPLNWSFLQELAKKGPHVKAKCMAVAARQAVISGTAKKLIDNYLSNIDETCAGDIEIALELLVDLCNGASSDILKHFYERICTCELAKDEQEKILKLLQREKDVTNRENLAMIVSAFINRNTSEISTDVVDAVPPSVLDMIHLPTAEKIRYRCQILRGTRTVENSISWLNELVVEQLNKNECRDLLITSMENLFTACMTFPKEKWLSDFIIFLQNRMIEKNIDDEGLRFLLNILMMGIVSMSGYFAISSTANGNFHKIFPQSVELISRQTSHDGLLASVFDFIIYAHSYETIPADIKETFTRAIIISKDNAHFRKSSNWQKVLQIIISKR